MLDSSSVSGAGGPELSWWRGSATDFHARSLILPVRREVWVFDVVAPALVLGSTQAIGTADSAACAAAGVELVRRRSGGGAVLLEPRAVVWFDVVEPMALLHAVGVGDDLRASMIWLGDRVVTALGGLGVGALDVHRGAPAGSMWSSTVCFAGLGPGEVTMAGVKLVGISQRRSRQGARFQCAVHVRWSPAALAGLLTHPGPTAADLPPVATLAVEVARALPAALAGAPGA